MKKRTPEEEEIQRRKDLQREMLLYYRYRNVPTRVIGWFLKLGLWITGLVMTFSLVGLFFQWIGGK